MITSRQDIKRAEAFGRLAARTGLGVDSCPYPADGAPHDRVMAARFVRAYLGAGGQVAVDYEDGAGPTRGRPRPATVDTADGPVSVEVSRHRPG